MQKDFRVKGAFFKQYIIVTEVLFCLLLPLSSYFRHHRKSFSSFGNTEWDLLYFIGSMLSRMEEINYIHLRTHYLIFHWFLRIYFMNNSNVVNVNNTLLSYYWDTPFCWVELSHFCLSRISTTNVIVMWVWRCESFTQNVISIIELG